jgi:rod shape-determining protein MreC
MTSKPIRRCFSPRDGPVRNSALPFTPRLDWIVFLVTVGFSLTLLFLGRGPAASAVKLEIGGLIAYAAKPVGLVRRSFGLWKENKVLRTQMMELSRENAQLRDATLENARLRAMLGFRDRFPLPLKSAEVMGFPGLSVGGRVLLNVGSADDVQVNSAVLTPDGLVGKVVEISPHSSIAQTLQGNTYGVSVYIERSRVAGILRWTGAAKWDIVGLSTGEDVRVGDLVLTTGAGSVFPQNVRVGVVTKVTGQHEASRGWCQVHPFVRFESLEEVFVTTRPDRSAPADSLSSGEAWR